MHIFFVKTFVFTVVDKAATPVRIFPFSVRIFSFPMGIFPTPLRIFPFPVRILSFLHEWLILAVDWYLSHYDILFLLIIVGTGMLSLEVSSCLYVLIISSYFYYCLSYRMKSLQVSSRLYVCSHNFLLLLLIIALENE